MPLREGETRAAGFLDIGTNAIRLLIARVGQDGRYWILENRKEGVRLGEEEYDEGKKLLSRHAIQKGLEACGRLMVLCERHGVSEIVAVGTAALREAENREVFLEKLRSDYGLSVEVISGQEEAKWVYLGAASGVDMRKRRLAVIDIGGGSTEIALGDERGPLKMETLCVGAVKLTGLFGGFCEKDPVSPKKYADMKDFVRHELSGSRLLEEPMDPDWVLGVSGTVANLCGIAKKKGCLKHGALRLCDLKIVSHALCRMPYRKRKEVPGLNPQRADVIVAGAAILETLLEDLGFKAIRSCRRGLKEGLFVDYLAKKDPIHWGLELSSREKSVRHLARHYGCDEKNSERVAELSQILLTSAQEVGFCRAAGSEGELLRYAALLRGAATSFSFHGRFSQVQDAIRGAELWGFAEDEEDLLAALLLLQRETALLGEKAPHRGLFKGLLRKTQRLGFFLILAEEIADDPSLASARPQFFKAGPDRYRLVFEDQGRGQGHAIRIGDSEGLKRAFHRTFGARLFF